MMRSSLSRLILVLLSLPVGLSACGGDAEPQDTADLLSPFGDTTGPPTSPDTGGPPQDVVNHQPDTSSPPPVVRDPCADVGLFGRCVGNTVETCVYGTGGASTYVNRLPCGFGYICTDSGFGPQCLDTRECVDGETRCYDDENEQTCVGGRWSTPQICDTLQCRESFGTGACGGWPVWAYQPFSGTVTFEMRGVNADWTDWTREPGVISASGLVIGSVANGDVIDATVTAEDGSFSLEIIAPDTFPDTESHIVVLAWSAEPDELDVNDIPRFVTADPGANRGELDIRTPGFEHLSEGPAVWSWAWNLADLSDGEELRVREAEGSGAMSTHIWMALVEYALRLTWGERPQANVLAWFGYGTTWSCGACFLNAPMRDYGNQIFIGGGPDAGYWSLAVLFHEVGHWAMQTYGFSPGEGGTHILGIPQHPGLAWSEGFATALSAVLRNERTYYDKQDGGFFWVDLDSRRYSNGSPWYLPSPEYGLMQLIDENEVARMVIELADVIGDDFFDAITSERMTQPPFARGYTRRRWDELDEDGWPSSYESTDTSVPMLADYLDALRCEYDVSRTTIDSVTQPATDFPYPSGAPLCDAVSAPIAVSVSVDGANLVAQVDRFIPLEEDLVLAFEPGGEPIVVPAGTPAGSGRIVWAPSAAAATGGHGGVAPQGPVGLRYKTGGESWGIAGLARPEPERVQAPVRADIPVRFGRHRVYPVHVAPLTAADQPYRGERAHDRVPLARKRK